MSEHRPLEADRVDRSPGAAWVALEAEIERVEKMLEVKGLDLNGPVLLAGALSNLLAARLVAAELRELERTLDGALDRLADRLEPPRPISPGRPR